MLEDAIPGHNLPSRWWGLFQDGEDGRAMESFWYLGAVWALRIQRRYAVLFMRTMHGTNWPHGLRFEEGNPTQLGRDQQLMRAALSRHAAVFRRPLNQHLRYGAPHLDRDRRGEEQPQ